MHPPTSFTRTPREAAPSSASASASASASSEESNKTGTGRCTPLPATTLQYTKKTPRQHRRVVFTHRLPASAHRAASPRSEDSTSPPLGQKERPPLHARAPSPNPRRGRRWRRAPHGRRRAERRACCPAPQNIERFGRDGRPSDARSADATRRRRARPRPRPPAARPRRPLGPRAPDRGGKLRHRLARPPRAHGPAGRRQSRANRAAGRQAQRGAGGRGGGAASGAARQRGPPARPDTGCVGFGFRFWFWFSVLVFGFGSAPCPIRSLGRMRWGSRWVLFPADGGAKREAGERL